MKDLAPDSVADTMTSRPAILHRPGKADHRDDCRTGGHDSPGRAVARRRCASMAASVPSPCIGRGRGCNLLHKLRD